MQSRLDKLGKSLFQIYIIVVLIWVHIALLFDITMITLHFVDDSLSRKVLTQIEQKITR
jgi:hypothetical protein